MRVSIWPANSIGGNMFRSRISWVVAACLVNTGCASGPDSIDAKYVSPTTYQSWACPQLMDERTRLVREVERVSGLQRENANADAALMGVGLILFWPALFGLAATKDRKEELGRLKGEYEAIDSNIKAKQCSLAPPNGTTTTAAAAQVTSFNGKYEGKGKTDSWCQTPSLTLSVSGTEIAGTISELSSGAPTGTVTGDVSGAGQVSLDVKSANSSQANGRFTGDITGNVLNVSMRTKGANVCSHRFALPKQ